MGALINENFTWGNVMTSYTTGTEGCPAPVLIYWFFLELLYDRKMKELREKIVLTEVEKLIRQDTWKSVIFLLSPLLLLKSFEK